MKINKINKVVLMAAVSIAYLFAIMCYTIMIEQLGVGYFKLFCLFGIITFLFWGVDIINGVKARRKAH